MQSELISSNDRLWAILSYVFAPIVGVVVLLIDEYKNRPFTRYHAIQSLGFAAAALAYTIVFTILFGVISAVTLGIASLCLWVGYFVPLVFAIYYAMQASQNRYFEIPWLTSFMIQQGWLTPPPPARMV